MQDGGEVIYAIAGTVRLSHRVSEQPALVRNLLESQDPFKKKS